MAIRPVFRVGKENNKENSVNVIECEFKWFSGFAKSQKQKSIYELHKSYLEKEGEEKKVLEISSSSPDELGIKLSAFNLMIKDKNNEDMFSVESLFQSCKKFENGGPYKDIRNKNSRDAKKDERNKNSGDLICFVHKGREWPLEPKTIFYDWIYMNALNQNVELKKEMVKYDAFTDIEFNPKKSINCQARSAALYVWLFRNNLIEKVMKSEEEYLKFFLPTTNIAKTYTQLEFDL